VARASKPPETASELLERYAAGERQFAHAQLEAADLPGAALAGACLAHSNLTGADLSGAALRGTDFSNCRLDLARLNGADLGGPRVEMKISSSRSSRFRCGATFIRCSSS
jgi:uncharacterized protein YjbI with pentapeptide repeats